MNPLAIKAIATAVILALAFGTGWKVKGWKDDSVKLAQAEAVQNAVDAFHELESKIASTLEDKLATLKANERVVERETIKIIDRPVYRNECLDADGLRLIEAARAGKTEAGKSGDEVPATK